MADRKRLTRGERNIRWIEQHCCIPEGRLVGKQVKLTEHQKKWIKRIYDSPTRMFILSMARKNAKTALSAFLLLLHLCGPEARPNSQLYSAAQSRDQAAILFELAAKVVRMSPDLSQYVNIRDTAKELLCGELGPEIVKGPANVTGRRDTAAMLDRASKDVQGSGLNVEIHNYGNDKVTTELGEDGRLRVIIKAVEDSLVGGIASGDSRLGTAMERSYGMRRQGR